MAPPKKTPRGKTKVVTAAEPKNVKVTKKGTEIGESGTQIFGGIINEDYNPRLSGTAGIKVYDEMRRSDATVKAALLAIQLPIRRAQWFVKSGGETPQDEAVADFISAALFDYQDITWDDFLRQSLLSTTYGVMVFEKVFQTKLVEGVTRICWSKFAPRLPKSILLWEMGNGKPGIQQMALEGSDANIPMEKLLVFVNDKEGDDWWGISVLRSAYKHWYIKSNLEKIDAIANERQGLGVPFVKLSGPTNTQEEITKAQTLLKNMRANDQGYLVEPEGITVEFKDMKASTTKDASKSIHYHNREIALSVLAQFLDLGSGSTGSRSLSEDHTKLFLHSLEAIANNIVDVLNKAIQELCDLNFDNVENYPELDYTGIQQTDIEEISVAYQRLVQAGGIAPQESDEKYLREVMSLPEKEEGTEPAEPEEKEIDDEADELGLSEHMGKKKIVPKRDVTEFAENVAASIEAKIVNLPFADALQFCSIHLERIKRITTHRELFDEAQEYLGQRQDDLHRLVFIENAKFDAWRELFFAEKKVNFQNINDFMDREEVALIEQSNRILIDAKDKYVTSLTKAVQRGDSKRIKELEIRFKTEYSALIKETLLKSYEFGKNNASREMGVKTPGNSSDITKSIDVQANSIADAQAAKITNEAKQIISDNINKGKNVSQTMGLVDTALVATIEKLTKDTSAIVVSGYINTGRDRVFRKHSDKIYAVMRSELLDQSTCNFCLSVDGRIVELDDDIARVGVFHSNCFVMGTPVLTKEGYKPIEELRVGDIVATHKDNWNEVYHTMSRGYEGDIIEIELENGDIIKCTPEHKFWVNDGWVEARKLTTETLLSDSHLDV